MQCRDCAADLPEGSAPNRRYCSGCADKRHVQWKRHAPAERLDLRHAGGQQHNCELRSECLKPVRGDVLLPPCVGCRRYTPPVVPDRVDDEIRRHLLRRN